MLTITDCRYEVQAYAVTMEEKLRAHDDRPGWKNDDAWDLFTHLEDEVGELQELMTYTDSDKSKIRGEAADIGNMAMMVCDVLGHLNAPSRAEQLPAMTLPAETPGAADVAARDYYLRYLRMAHHTKFDEQFLVRELKRMLTAARAAGFAEGRERAVAVCRAREQMHERNADKYIMGAPECTAHTCYSLEADECADAIAALTPPAPAAAKESERV